MEANSGRVCARVNPQLKKKAEALYKSMGLDMSTAINLFLTQSVREQAIPFPITAYRQGQQYPYSLDEITTAFGAQIRKDNEERAARGLPVAGYDSQLGQAYLQYPDGTREIIHAPEESE